MEDERKNTHSAPEKDNHFCIPEQCCPERKETPKYPSPTSCLPEDELEELEKKITEANRLLLDLGLSGELPIEGRRIALTGLIGKMVKVKLNCDAKEAEAPDITIEIRENPNESEKLAKTATQGFSRKKKRKEVSLNKRGKKRRTKLKRSGVRSAGKSAKTTKNRNVLEGIVQLVGRDFVLLSVEENQYAIPLKKVSSTLSSSRIEEFEDEPSLLDIDPCFRRSLTFHFGETVASSPHLINLFYGLPFALYLLTLESVKTMVKTADGLVSGNVRGVDSNSLSLTDQKGSERVIAIESICYIMK